MAEAFVPLSFAPGEAYQFDWSHEVVLINGVTVAVKVALCSESTASGQALLPFRSLDPFRPLREPDRRRRGRRTAFPLRTKNGNKTKNDYLTEKARARPFPTFLSIRNTFR
jgi:hypothetical protein